MKKLIASIMLLVMVVSIASPIIASADSNKGKGHDKKERKYEFRERSNSDDDEDEDDEDSWKNSLPPGIKKRLENGKGLPFGIWKKIFGNYNDHDDDDEDNDDGDEDDNDDLEIELRSVTNIGTSTATVVIETNVKSKARITYSRESDLSPSDTEESNTWKTRHEIKLTDLEDDSAYYYRVRVTDEDGDVIETNVKRFDTSDIDDSNNDDEDLEIEYRNVTTGTSTATILVETNIKSKAKVEYSKDSDMSPAEVGESNTWKTDHEIKLSGLTPDTMYYYRIVVESEEGEKETTSVRRFYTQEFDNSAPNIISLNRLDTSSTTVSIIWVTNEKTDGNVWVSTSTPDTNATSTATLSGFTYVHNVTIDGLQASTTYNLVVRSKDVDGNATTSAPLVFTTDIN